jgi:nodulation protein E
MVTGLGCNSALGEGVPTAWSNMVSGYCGIAAEEIAVAGQPGLSIVAAIGRLQFDPVPQLKEQFGRKAISAVDRVSNLAAAATVEALRDAGLETGNPLLKNAAIVYATSIGGVGTLDHAFHSFYGLRSPHVHPLTVPRIMGSGPVSHISMLFGVQGISYAVMSACSSSTHAIAEGMHMIRSGRADIAIVGGTDASITYGNMHAWKALQALSDIACRPFSAGRDGTILGEGAATIILEAEEVAQRRGARIYAELAGSGASADSFHITKPSAEGAAAAIRGAHRDAQVELDEPVLISAHGTGTVLNDKTEAEAWSAVYGERLWLSRIIASKSNHGHMLGATGAMEFLLLVLALHHQKAPALQGYLGEDPECRLPIVLQTEDVQYRTAISASFAFGGLNCALIARLV